MARLSLVLAILLICACGSSSKGTGDTTDTTPGNDGLAGDSTGEPGDSLTGDKRATETSPDLTGDPDTTGPCTEGALSCLGDSVVQECVGGLWQVSANCSSGSICKDGKCIKEGACTPGASDGCEGYATQWKCNEAGTGFELANCPDGQMCFDGECKVAECVPGSGMCMSSSLLSTCLPDGSGYGEPVACEAGKACIGGFCLTLCEADIKQNTNVGCQYWSVDLDNDPTHHPLFPNQPTPEMFPHSIVISNPSDTDVSMAFTIHMVCADGSECLPSVTTCNFQEGTVCDKPTGTEYDIELGDPIVPAGQSREFKMPVLNVSGSSLTPKAIRVTASRPVVAYQFNPFNSENAASNDGSLLLPQNAIGMVYYAVSLPSRGAIMSYPENNGFVAIVATQPNTTVNVTPTVKVKANPAQGIPQDGSTPEFLTPGQTYTFTLQPFHVLNLEQLAEGGVIPPGTYPKDLTGTRVEADRPVAVFSGHQVAGVQELQKQQLTDIWDSCCTEHLEEQLMPVETWGTEAFCVKSKPRGYEADRFVVVAGEPNVTITTNPEIMGLDNIVLEKAGDSIRVETQDSFILSATGKIQVVQFLVSQGQTQQIGGEPGTGDPSMLVIPPSSQYRDEYVIQTAEGYGTNWVTIIRKAGVDVLLDNTPVGGAFEPLGDGTWEFGYHQVEKGTHSLKSDEPFGLMVYGYGTVTAYGYPGGMKLEQ